ncbi:hypothetical protein M406DRAFT_246004 [Cryphonectria parasitica EP155]|uniref:Heparan-alpha-glucosaminide N-acetyltransferase catalytic domain-containing protein n=1 Tax=Cryphonectria parasitica (strain ATCC 38755 / EP155) TaxID=660469 RepID=A0A9P5CTD7_CRYP1|nr:uncharacterized protein M406DRAFT_246004 [Cryphonectria parasitica EP155]KAF3769562.1 hypothetical protein M406DRAFT_246004 [Cryphonectria parasitica EP155]
MEVVRAVPDGAVQETSFEDDTHEHVTNDDTRQEEPDNRQSTPRDDSHTSSYGSISVIREGNSHSTPPLSSSTPVQDTPPSKLSATTKSTDRALAPDILRGFFMILMALDHNFLVLRPWPISSIIINHNNNDSHGERDHDDVPAHTWNQPVAYIIRLLTHLWPPGLLFLLGMGIVYFGQSRRALGWSAGMLVRHLLVRVVILVVLSVLLGLLMTLGRVWFMSLVLFALAVDYLLVGILWLVISRAEETLAYWLLQVLPDAKKDDANEPLLADRRGHEDIAPDRKIMRAADISWHFHNIVLLALAIVSIWWNMWRSPSRGEEGHCKPDDDNISVLLASPSNNWFRVWIDVFVTKHVASLHPPLAWLSFVVLGLLYGRVVVGRTWTRTALTLGNAVFGLVFLLVFVLTRLLHFGNLSEGCLRMPEHAAHPDRNQYLVSWRSFFFLHRYPPEVAYWAYAMGVNFTLLTFFSAIPHVISSTVLHPLQVVGTSAFFFYVVHLLPLFISWLVWSHIYDLPMSSGPWLGDDEGVPSEWAFWVNWAVVLVIMYLLCRWYGTFKKARRPDSLWRFF